jgi:hypothetical protein
MPHDWRRIFAEHNLLFLKVARPLFHSSEDRAIRASAISPVGSKMAFRLDRRPDSLLTPIQRQFTHGLKFRLR